METAFKNIRRTIPLLTVVFDLSCNASLELRRIQIAPSATQTQVPEATAQGQFLAPQAISTVDISADNQFITVGTMAFSHDANIWQFSPDGAVLAKRHFPPWAPLQATTLPGGRAMAVGLAYSRVTSPDPTIWLGKTENLFAADLRDDLSQSDPLSGQFARLRPGAGDWRLGWLASSFGELFARGPNWIFKPEKQFLTADGQIRELRYEDQNLFPTTHAMRMAASADGKHLAFGSLGFSQPMPALSALSVWQVEPNRKLWSVASTITNPSPSLPDPIKEFGGMAKKFRLAPDALVPGHVSSSIAINHDGSRVALVEYAIWGWLRNAPAIGKWDPPIHFLNFLPRQRGQLRVFDADGHVMYDQRLPEEGMFEVAFSGATNEIWLWPTSWFARGMAGAVWLPTDPSARTIFKIEIGNKSMLAFDFPDTIADASISPTNNAALVSCWDGSIRLLNSAGKSLANLSANSPARLAWSADNSFAIAGTAKGRLIRIEKNGTQTWSKRIPITDPPPATQPPDQIVQGLPIYQGGRIHKGEHAYVGDIWIVKNGAEAVLVDAGGLSGFSITQQRLRDLGIDRVTHVLHTHSHGDHCGAAYLWRATGAKIVAPKVAALPLTWLMPMFTDYGIYPPRPVDLPLPLAQAGDETDFDLSGLKFRALFVPGHSFDLTIYKIELAGKRIAFTGDLGFENQDILHRCWGDTEKARALVPIIRNELLQWHPDIVFTGHGVRTNGTQFIADLIQSTERSLAK